MSHKTTTFLVKGMSCSGCSSKLEKALLAVKGVSTAKVVIEGGQVIVAYDSILLSVEQLFEVVNGLGFDVVS